MTADPLFYFPSPAKEVGRKRGKEIIWPLSVGRIRLSADVRITEVLHYQFNMLLWKADCLMEKCLICSIYLPMPSIINSHNKSSVTFVFFSFHSYTDTFNTFISQSLNSVRVFQCANHEHNSTQFQWCLSHPTCLSELEALVLSLFSTLCAMV